MHAFYARMHAAHITLLPERNNINVTRKYDDRIATYVCMHVSFTYMHAFNTLLEHYIKSKYCKLLLYI